MDYLVNDMAEPNLPNVVQRVLSATSRMVPHNCIYLQCMFTGLSLLLTPLTSDSSAGILDMCFH
jgi:hypothetical protein